MRCPIFVGGAEEVDLLSGAVGSLPRGQGSTTLLVGEAGIGKTRLVEFAVNAAERAGIQALIGRAVPELTTRPLRPVAEALLELTRDCPPPPDDTFAPYVPQLATLLPHWRSDDWRPPEEPLLVMAEAVFKALRRLCAISAILALVPGMAWHCFQRQRLRQDVVDPGSNYFRMDPTSPHRGDDWHLTW